MKNHSMKLQFKMLTINRYRSMVFPVMLSLLEPRFSTPFLQNDREPPLYTVFTYVTVTRKLTPYGLIEADPSGRPV